MQLTHLLAEARSRLSSIHSQPEASGFQTNLVEAIAKVDEAIAHAHELALDLRTSELKDLGLAAALRWYVNRYTMRWGIAVEVIGDTTMGTLPPEVETACFRIAQEALENTARHARATKATISLERRPGQLHLAVHDNGIGFNPRKFLDTPNSVRAPGLRGMQERALAIRAEIEINSRHGAGTDIVVYVPLP